LLLQFNCAISLKFSSLKSTMQIAQHPTSASSLLFSSYFLAFLSIKLFIIGIFFKYYWCLSSWLWFSQKKIIVKIQKKQKKKHTKNMKTDNFNQIIAVSSCHNG
jgi:hypothetical protein